MKKIMLVLLVLASTLTAQADAYPYLTFQAMDGSKKSVEVASLVITVSDGKLLVTNTSGTQTFALAELSKMYFSSETTGIKALDGESTTEDGEVEYYDLSGRRIAGLPLTRGIYVVKQNGRTRKVMVK